MVALVCIAWGVFTILRKTSVNDDGKNLFLRNYILVLFTAFIIFLYAFLVSYCDYNSSMVELRREEIQILRRNTARIMSTIPKSLSQYCQ